MTDEGLERRLRATLRLCFAPAQAAALAAKLAEEEPDQVAALAPVVRAARLSYTTGRWLAPFRRRSNDVQAPPLLPGPSLSALPALSLALHLGLDLDVETLARLFRTTTNEIGAALQQGRQEVDPTHISPCPEFGVPIGRYRDPSHDRLKRLEYLQHLEGCQRCQLALDHAREVDDELIIAINQAEDEPLIAAETPASGRSLWLGPFLLWVGLAVLVLLVVVGAVAGSRRLLAKDQPPVPLVAGDTQPSQLNGWLLQTSTTGKVEAVNLSNGVRRLLLPGSPSARATVMISPDRQRIAELSDDANQTAANLHVFSIDGTQQREWTGLDLSGQYQLLGWLDTNRLMTQRIPLRNQGESADAFNQRLANQAALVVFDAQTGEERVLAQARFTAASASPDGHFVALQRITGDGSVTLEIRPVQGDQLGEPVATVPHMTFADSNSPVLWTPDSQHVVFWARGIVDPSTNRTPIDVMTLDGRITPLYQTPGNAFGSLLTISPDGRTVVYAEGETGTTTAPWAYWEINIDGGQPQKLHDGGDLGQVLPMQRSWSPVVYAGSADYSTLLLTETTPFYLPNPQSGSTQTGVASYVTLAFDATGQPLGDVLDQFAPLDLLSWLPNEALAAVDQMATPASASFQQQQHDGPPLSSPLTDDSQVSPDGSKVLINQTYSFSVAYGLGDSIQQTPQLAGAPHDASWLPDSSGVIGVQQHTTSNGERSRISLYGDIGNGILGLTDFDPAQLGENTTATYRHPMLSPNGLRYSFFVVDRQAVALWAGSKGGSAHIVASWIVPGNAKFDVPLLARWAGNDTLVFAEPDDWSGGFPHQVALKRVTFSSEGSTTVEPLLSWRARGGEKDVTLQELKLSPDRSKVAWRLRRFTGSNLTTDRFDAVDVADSADLTQSVELARGRYGDGMSWSPDGTELVAPIDGGLQLMSSDGHDVQQIDTGEVTVAYPVWVLPNEIWYQAIDPSFQAPLRATR
jgi:hypothetical protein